MKIIVIMALIGTLEALHCDKEFNYYDSYGNGFDVTCQGITKEHLHLIENITINNEISLRIENSILENITSKLFNNVQNIRYFYLENSTFTCATRHAAFELLTKLQHLAIKNTNFHINKYTFKNLADLQELILSNNSLEHIEPDSFEGLPNLRHLEISNNKIKDIGNIPLCELSSLRALNLSRNLIRSLKLDHFYCTNSNQTLDMHLNNQELIVSSGAHDFSRIIDYSLEMRHLDLSFNEIQEMGGSLNDLKFIQILRLQGNKLRHIANSDLTSLSDLQEAHFEDNLLETVGEKLFEGKENLEYINLSNNQLKLFSLNDAPTLRYLNLGNNKLSSIILGNIKLLKSLRTLILQNNKFETIEPHIFHHFASLELLDLSQNNVKLNDLSFSGLFQLKSLSLKENNINTMPKGIFNDMKSLQALDISMNKLKSIEYSDIFVSLKYLRSLNLSYNHLENLNYDLLQPLDNLKELDIEGNKLRNIQYELILSNLPYISVLNIKSNLLSCEILKKIIFFLKAKHVSYTIVEKFDDLKENVAGIYCNNEGSPTSLQSLSRPSHGDSSTLLDLSISVLIVLVTLIIGIVLFKIYVYLKRRKYRADEFELINE